MSRGADQLRKPESDSITLGDERQALEILAQSIQGLWEVVNNLTRLRPTKRLEIPHCVDTAQEGVSIIRPRYEEWIRVSA